MFFAVESAGAWDVHLLLKDSWQDITGISKGLRPT